MKLIIRLSLVLTVFIYSGLSFAKGVTVDDPYVRAIPPGQTISASFMTLVNDSDKAIDLVKATSDIAKNVELHEHVHEDGMMKMRQVPKISIAAQSKTELKPGGYHIMLIDLVKGIKPTDMITINLEFSDGSTQEIKAEVRKIMMGMKKKVQFMQHANPMPNLLAVYKKMGSELNLSDEQKSKLDAGIKDRNPKVKELFASIKDLEKKILEATLNDEPLSKVDQLGDQLMQARIEIINGKAGCRESIKEVLDEKQFQKIVELYRRKMMPKAKNQDENQAKKALMKHINPLPNLMQVIINMGDKLNLTELQSADLKKWRDERDPVVKKTAKMIVKLEADLLDAALNNEPLSKIDQLADAIMKNRMKIVRGKAFCRDNMKRILDNDQYKNLLNLYKTTYKATK